MSSTVEGLDRGVVGTESTIKKMHKLVALGKLDPTFQKIATWIRASVSSDPRAKTAATADAVFNWVQKHGIFQPDPFQIEKIEHPIEAMRPIIEARRAGTYTGPGLFVGDCDTFSIVTATLGGILGFQYAFETAKVDRLRPDEYSHVWTSLLVGKDWRALDSSTPGVGPGWRPPVDEKLFARWPEKPIENVVGKSEMNAFNEGLGEFAGDEAFPEDPLAGVDAAYPKDYISYGIPKDFGAGPGVIPPGNFEDLQLLVPHNTQIPSADMEPDMHMLKAAPRLDPSERIQSIEGQPNDHGNPYYTTGGRTPQIKIVRQFYPPGSRWNGHMGHDAVRYVKTGPHIKVKAAESPERKVKVSMDQPLLVRRRNVVVAPRRVPFGTMEGMGDLPGAITSYDQMYAPTPTPTATATPTGTTAAAAGGSVWDTISSVFKAAGTVVPSVMQSQAAQAVVNATNKLAGRNVMGLQQQTPWYTNPWVIAFGLAAAGGTAYLAMAHRPGSSGRRRR